MAEVVLNLSCSVCLDHFKTPKVLTCGHTYCLPCVSQLVNRRVDPPTLQCPTCRRQVDFPQSGRTEDLITNFQLKSMVEQQIEELNRKAGSSKLRARVGSQLSDCHIHKITNELYCRTCEEPICTKCTLAEHDVGEHEIITKSKFLVEMKKTYRELLAELPNIRSVHRRLEEEAELRTRHLLEEKRWMQDRIQQALERKQEQLLESARKLKRELDRSCSTEERDEFLVKLASQHNMFETVQRQSENIQAELDAGKFTTSMDTLSENLKKMTGELVELASSLEELPYMTHQVYDASAGARVDVGSLKPNPNVDDIERHYRAAFLIDDATKIHMKV